MFNRGKRPTNQTSIDPNLTANLCNQFLIVRLISKIQVLEGRGQTDAAFAYKKAITSIKKYPMPIISRSQLKGLQGIGDKLSDQLERAIATHYKAYLDRNLEEKDLDYGSEAMSTQTNLSSNVNLERRFEHSIQEESVQSENQNDFEETNSRSVRSVLVGYKPRVNTVNSNFLLTLKALSSRLNQEEKIAFSMAKDHMDANFAPLKQRTWKGMENILEANGYISITRQACEGNENKSYELTEKGHLCCESLQQKTKIASSRSRVISQVKSFKSEVDSKANLKMEGGQQDKQQLPNCGSQGRPKGLLLGEQNTNFDQDAVLELIIDSRERKQKSDIDYFEQKLSKKYNVKSRMANLSIGDFLWVYGGQVLDFVVERKKADDLASSILDGRYKDQKYRLKRCGISNVFYLYEGHPSNRCAKTQKQLGNALLKVRVKDGFKVVQTKSVAESLRFLSQVHQQIQGRIQKGQIKCFGTLQEFNSLNSTQKNLSTRQSLEMGLLTVPGLGKTGVNLVTQYFQTYCAIYERLKLLGDNLERVEFLKGLFKGKNITSNLPRFLVALLFPEVDFPYKSVRKQKSAFNFSSAEEEPDIGSRNLQEKLPASDIERQESTIDFIEMIMKSNRIEPGASRGQREQKLENSNSDTPNRSHHSKSKGLRLEDYSYLENN